MTNLGAGVDQHINTTALPTWVYSPPAFVAGQQNQPTLRLFNEGTQLLYVGGINVSPFNGLALPPGSKPLEIQNAQFSTVYTCSNSFVGANTAAGTASGAVAAGASSIPVSSYSTAITVGSTIIYGAGASAAGYEVLVVSATAATTITTTTPLLYDHATGVKFTLATTTIGQLRATAGA